MSAVSRTSERDPQECNGIAIFDLDFTVVPFDTMLLLCNYVRRRQRWRLLYLIVFLPAALVAAARLISSRTIKRFFFSFAFRMSAADLSRHANNFVQTEVVPNVFPQITEAINRHRSNGDYLILNTASPMFYAELIARELSFDACCATNLIVRQKQSLLPSIPTPNNKHAAKLDAMTTLLPADLHPALEARGAFERGNSSFEPAPLAGCVAYSDSTADLPILRLGESAVVVAPGDVLLSEARQRSWKIIQPAMPFASNRSKWLMMLKQALGLYRTPTAD